jgi:hypothetical protein
MRNFERFICPRKKGDGPVDMPIVAPMKTMDPYSFLSWYMKHRVGNTIKNFESLSTEDRRKARKRLVADVEAEKPLTPAQKRKLVIEVSEGMSGRDVQKDKEGNYYYPRKQTIQGSHDKDILLHLHYRFTDDAYAHSITEKQAKYAQSVLKILKEHSSNGRIMMDEVEDLIKHPPA